MSWRLLVITKSTFEDHLRKLKVVFQRIKEAGLKINANKSFFARSALEYLGYWITRKGTQPVPKKVDAIKKIAVPKTIKELRSFVGMINYMIASGGTDGNPLIGITFTFFFLGSVIVFFRNQSKA